MDTCICMTESFCCPPETNNHSTVNQLYSNIKLKKFLMGGWVKEALKTPGWERLAGRGAVLLVDASQKVGSPWLFPAWEFAVATASWHFKAFVSRNQTDSPYKTVKSTRLDLAAVWQGPLETQCLGFNLPPTQPAGALGRMTPSRWPFFFTYKTGMFISSK